MTPVEFRKEYFGEFLEPSPGERRAIELWCWYYVTCEDYDRTVCTGMRVADGSAVPGNPRERGLVSRHAVGARRRIGMAAATESVSDADMRAAKERVQWWSLDEMRRHAVGPRPLDAA